MEGIDSQALQKPLSAQCVRQDIMLRLEMSPVVSVQQDMQLLRQVPLVLSAN